MSKKRRIFKDRSDARRIDGLSGLSQICIDLKPRRCDSDVYINQKMDISILEKWYKEKKKEYPDLTYFHLFVTAIGKLFYVRPKLNRFVTNRHIYEHNDIVISFVAKVSFDDSSEEMMVLIPIEDNDNIYSISNKILDNINKYRKKEVKKEGANDAIDFFGKLPNILRIPAVGLFKWLDKKGWLPKAFIKDNLYYSSIIVSNLGSIKCGAIYHNITNFGTCSGLLTMGEIKTEEYIDENSKKKLRRICEFGVNLDERIADGYYYAKSLNILQYLFDHPELLEENINEKIEEIEIR